MTQSTSLYFQRSAEQMSSLQKDLGKSQMQLGSGVRVIDPSDDPRTATEITRLQTSIRKLDSYQDTIQDLEIRMSIQDNVLKNVSDVLIRVRELALQAANGSYTAQDRKIIAVEARELTAELASIANVQDQSGNFVFGGTRVSVPPYQKDAGGNYQYTGDHTEVLVPISDTRAVLSHHGGQDIFGSVVREENTYTRPVRVGAFEAFNDFVAALEANDLESITRGITEITKIRETVDIAIARIGSRRSVLQGQSQVNEETGIQLKKLLSDVKDLDYAEKVTEMQSQMTLLQAAQASFAKISQLSVWNYLK